MLSVLWVSWVSCVLWVLCVCVVCECCVCGVWCVVCVVLLCVVWCVLWFVVVCCCVLLCAVVCCCVLLCAVVCCCVLLCAVVCCCVLLCAVGWVAVGCGWLWCWLWLVGASPPLPALDDQQLLVIEGSTWDSTSEWTESEKCRIIKTAHIAVSTHQRALPVNQGIRSAHDAVVERVTACPAVVHLSVVSTTFGVSWWWWWWSRRGNEMCLSISHHKNAPSYGEPCPCGHDSHGRVPVHTTSTHLDHELAHPSSDLD